MVSRWFILSILLVVSVSSVCAVDQDEKLATLAAKMLNLSQDIGSGDYAMDCGPASEVLNIPPTGARSAYCVLITSSKTIIGTYDDPTAQNVRQLMLRTYNDTQFASHLDIKNVKTTACDGKGIDGFEECPNALPVRSGTPVLPALKVYVYDDELASESIYLLISDAPLNSVKNTRTFFGSIAEFFKGLFA